MNDWQSEPSEAPSQPIQPANPAPSPPPSKILMSHEGWPGGLITKVEYRRRHEESAISKRAREEHEALVAERLLRPAMDLPEMIAFQTLKGKDTGIQTILDRLDLDLKALEIQRSKTILEMEGLALATKLSKLDKDRLTIAQKMSECKNGQKSFNIELATAEVQARKALAAFRMKTMPELLSAVKAHLQETKTAIDAADSFFALLDDHAVADHAGRLLRMSHQIEAKLEALLTAPVTKTAKPAPAESEPEE